MLEAEAGMTISRNIAKSQIKQNKFKIKAKTPAVIDLVYSKA